MIPAPTPTNSLQRIMMLSPPMQAVWNVMAYAIPVDADDTMKSVVFLLGSFPTELLANEHAKHVIEQTGHSKVIVSKYGMPVPLSTTVDPTTIIEVPVDLNNKLIHMEQQDYEEQKQRFDKRQTVEQELLLEIQNEDDTHHMEHYKHNMYLTLKHYDTYLQYREKSNHMFQLYKQRKQKTMTHYHAHPEHDQHFLDFLQPKLVARDEATLFEWIKNNYHKHRKMILNIKN